MLFEKKIRHFLFLTALGAAISNAASATQVVLELDISWASPEVGGSIAPDWGGLNNSSDIWTVNLQIGDIDLSSGSANVATEASGKFSASVDSSTALPIGVAPANDHDYLESYDAAVKQRFEIEQQANGAVVLADVIRGARSNVQPFSWWRFDREISNILPVGAAITSANIVAALNNPGGTFTVAESFTKQGVATFSKRGVASVRSVFVDGQEHHAGDAPATCRYVIATQWPDGFVANVFIKNDTNEEINGWNLNVNFTGGGRIVHSWATALNGAAPNYTAANLSWNYTIYPGQEINFGFQGVKTPDQTAAAMVQGSICK